MAAATRAVDIGKAISVMISGPGWLGKSLFVGAIALFIPLLGHVLLMGWMREIFERTKVGERTLPKLDFRHHLSQGWAPFTTVFSISVGMIALFVGSEVAIIMLSTLLTGAPGEEMAPWRIALLLLGMAGVALVGGVSGLLTALLAPDLVRRGLRGEALPILGLMGSARAVRSNLSGYFMVALGAFSLFMFAHMGQMLCLVGVVLTVPMAAAGLANLLAQWDMALDEST